MRHVPTDVVAALQANRIIEAIKAWRDYTGDSLKDAKDFIEQNRAEILGLAAPKPEPKMPEELPKQELLTKLLKMTASPNDGEALTAIRKANALLSAAGWDWDKLIAGKIVVVGDPFASMPDPTPPKTNGTDHRPPRPPNNRFSHAASRAPKGPSAAPPPPPPRPRQSYSSKRNIYPGGCYCCGKSVDVDQGFVFKPSDINSRAQPAGLWAPICTDCNTTHASVPNSKAKRIFPTQHPSVSPDLNSL